MKPGIYFENIWFDNDVIELKTTVYDGKSSFLNKVYVAYPDLENLINGLDIFKNHVYGGLFNIDLGMFGPEYANGAFSARLHFYKTNEIYISIRMQSDFFDFGKKNVASESALYLISEPVLLDRFIDELKLINKEIGSNGVLECVEK